MAATPSLPRRALVLGGASDIALATVRRLARRQLDGVVLAVRDPDATRQLLRGAPIGVEQVVVERWDALEADTHEPLLERAVDHLGELDLVLCAVGALGHHAGRSLAPPAAEALLRTNFSGPAAALLAAGATLSAQGHGAIVVISSVAGARARRSNFVYGSAKAGLDAFAQGLRDALLDDGVRVHIIRPGFVVTKMTEGLDPAPLATTPEAVAEAVELALGSAHPRIIWVPRALGPALGALRVAPAPLWRRVAGDR